MVRDFVMPLSDRHIHLVILNYTCVGWCIQCTLGVAMDLGCVTMYYNTLCALVCNCTRPHNICSYFKNYMLSLSSSSVGPIWFGAEVRTGFLCKEISYLLIYYSFTVYCSRITYCASRVGVQWTEAVRCPSHWVHSESSWSPEGTV